MVHLIATLFFAGILVGLAVLLQHMLRDHWADMAAALAGRPMPGRPVRRPATVSVPKAKMRRAAA